MTKQEILAVAKPILFNTDMVRAILDGRKTATRRVVKAPYYIDSADVCQSSGTAMHKGTNGTHGMPYPDSVYRPGDYLYARETWDFLPATECGCFCLGPCDKEYHDEFGCFVYRASNPNFTSAWCPSIHMPKEAARLFLRVTNVRVVRLQEISPHDAQNEGIKFRPFNGNYPHFKEWLIKDFRDLWDSTIKKADLPLYGWEANPWVWVIEFERMMPKEA